MIGRAEILGPAADSGMATATGIVTVTVTGATVETATTTRRRRYSRDNSRVGTPRRSPVGATTGAAIGVTEAAIAADGSRAAHRRNSSSHRPGRLRSSSRTASRRPRRASSATGMATVIAPVARNGRTRSTRVAATAGVMAVSVAIAGAAAGPTRRAAL